MQNVREPKETLSEKEFRFRKNSGKGVWDRTLTARQGLMYFDIGHGRRRSRYVIGHIASWSLEAKHFNHCRTRWQQPTVVAGIREFCFLCFISFSYNSASWITLISSSINCFIAVGKCHQKRLVKILPKIFKSLPLATRQLPESGSLIRLLFSVLCPGFLWITSIIICFVLGGFLCFPTEPFFRTIQPLVYSSAFQLCSDHSQVLLFVSMPCIPSFQSVYSVLQLV